MKTKSIIVIIVLIISFINCNAQNEDKENEQSTVKGYYFGQRPPGETPIKFIFDLAKNEPNTHSSPIFSPDGKEVFITIMQGSPNKIKYSRMDDHSIWSPLTYVPFSSKYSDSNPFLSSDGSKIYFKSYRPINGRSGNTFWVSTKTYGTWSEAIPVDKVFNHPGIAWQSSISKKGSIFYPIEGADDIDIFYSELIDGHYTTPKNMGQNINSNVPDWQTCISSDESYLIFASNKREGGYGWGDLYVSFKNSDGTWTKAINLGSEINTPENEEWPSLTPDGKYLIFRRCEYSNDYIGYYMWVSTDVLEKLKN